MRAFSIVSTLEWFRSARFLAATVAVLVSVACGSPTPSEVTPTTTSTAAPAASPLDRKIARFAPVDITANVPALPQNEQAALGEIIRAAAIMDGLFLQQVWAGNTTLLTALAADRTPEGQAELHYFLINKGPWSRLDHDETFLNHQHYS